MSQCTRPQPAQALSAAGLFLDPEKRDFLIGLGDAAFLTADEGLELRPALGDCFSVSAGTGDCG